MKEAQLHRRDGQYSPRESSSWMSMIRRSMPDMSDIRRLMSDRRVRAAAGAIGTLLVSAVAASMRPKRKTGWRGAMARIV